MKTFKTLAATIDAKDPFTKHHSASVGKLCEGIARELGWSEKNIQLLVNAALMHDIGKINVPEAIISKPGKLNVVEKRVIEEHPSIGNNILKGIKLPGMEIIRRAVHEHHERWNGSGYPRRLKKKKISMEARIIAVADSFDAMTTARHYKVKKDKKTALDEILRLSGKLYDPEVVRAFKRYFKTVWGSS